MIHVMVLGTSEPQDFQLFENDQPFNGTGYTVEAVLGNRVSVTTEWLDQAEGKVRVSGTETMARGQYKFRFKITDGEGNQSYVPNQSLHDFWRVVRP